MIRVIFSLPSFILLFFSFTSFAQYNYSSADKNLILKNRTDQKKAFEEWNQKKLYSFGLFFEKIYDKYKDTSMAAAIHCYRIAASSESEYGDKKESYKAALRLANIYEKGKGVDVNLHRAMIYYYLSDPENISTYNKLGDPVQNKNFQRLKQWYCNRDTIIFRSPDSLTIGISPFCKVGGNKINTALEKIAEMLRQQPERKVTIKIFGDNSMYAAQYTLKVNNYVLQEIYDSLGMYFIEKLGISGDRLLPLEMNLDENQNDYYLTISFE